MVKDVEGEEGLWGIMLYLKLGKWRYKFVVDGEWIHDPKNPNKEILHGNLKDITRLWWG